MDVSTLPDLIDTRKTAEYRRWEDSLHDVAAAAIDARIKHLQHGKKGDWRPVGEGCCDRVFTDDAAGAWIVTRPTGPPDLLLLVATSRAAVDSRQRSRYGKP